VEFSYVTIMFKPQKRVHTYKARFGLVLCKKGRILLENFKASVGDPLNSLKAVERDNCVSPKRPVYEGRGGLLRISPQQA